MLSERTVAKLAEDLESAESARRPIRHFTRTHPDMTIEDGYAVQAAWVKRKVAHGAVVRGHKVGLTSRVMQEGAGIDEPDYGVLLDHMFFTDGATLPTSRYIAPRVEVELCFVTNRALRGPNCTIFDVLDATDYVVPALEIIDTRFHRFDPDTNAPRKIADTIADNAANCAVVIGGRPARPLETDLRWVSAVMYRNETIVESGVAAAVLNHPANSVAWLANRLAAHADHIAAGEIVLAGSFTRSVPVASGETYLCDYGPFGTITCRFG
ncbi:2-oxo-hept-4-ene-1,7-dioate hydratase [Spirillospora sp. NPDC048819]|uniref:2-oxo-hept-4-ene-1,7-dioate hydratase n=1 Tax=Spirillospora sp. NPDC048819 TaxID=3155268 RepID=UPI0033D94846